MLLILFLCINLSIIQLCVSDPDITKQVPPKDNVTLINYEEEWNNQFNALFKNKCQDFYDIYEVYPGHEEGYHNIIHFGVQNYNDNNYKDLVYAGDLNGTIDLVEVLDNKTNKLVSNERAKLVNKSVETINNGDLFNFVQTMQIIGNRIVTREKCFPYQQSPAELKMVLLCLNSKTNPMDVNINNIDPLKVMITNNCLGTREKYNDNFLAVLSPEPFKVNNVYSVPVLFYETPYLTAENKTTFPNAISVIPWRLLKYGFLSFIKQVGWQRLAIVSDQSEYSIAFEEELTALFNEERIVYTVVKCEEDKCNLAQALANIRPSVVIANVEEHKAKNLIKHSNERITWMVRDLVGAHRHKFITHNQLVFSLRLEEEISEKTKISEKLLKCLQCIAQAAQTTFTFGKIEVYKEIAKKVKECIDKPKPKALAFVRKLTRDKTFLVSKMSVDENGASVISYNDPFPSGKPADVTSVCLAMSYNYFKPCEHHLIIAMMFIILLFIIMIALIQCFFQQTSPQLKYQNF